MARKPTQIRFGSIPQRGLSQGTGSALNRAVECLPPLSGRPVVVRWLHDLRASRGKLRSGGVVGEPVHAGSFLRKRTITIDDSLLKSRPELSRILVHEIFHYVWLRAGNTHRREWEALLANELSMRVRGELGWSAEWRKKRLSVNDLAARTRRWREYCCESFCDTAAWLFARVSDHAEFTLSQWARAPRRAWFLSLRRHQSEGWRI